MLKRLLEPRAEAAYALLRVVAGLMWSFHGMQKIFGVFTEKQPPLFAQTWFGGIIELVCGLAIALGLFTRWAAFLASGTMFVAYTQFHWKLGTGAQLLPAVNKGELALLYCVVFFFMACKGSGPLAIDRARAG